MYIDYNYSHIMSLSCFRYLQNSFFPKEKYNVKCENLCDIDRNFLFGKSFSFKRILLRWRSKSLFVVQHENCLWARSWYHNRFQNAKWVTNYHFTFTHVIHKSRFLSLSSLFTDCKPLQIWMILRHGTRNTGKHWIKKLKNDLPQIQRAIIANHDS